ncbi:NAD(P)H-dependent oxidoreductase [Ferrimonas gelatinilytica]|uniref:NAD(P)H-dependent oxidoreductase n=1 Tax=Ferrimonas gelatinilytica TaxID=1255257 RepID=A0ABP9RYF3_9GAMM
MSENALKSVLILLAHPSPHRSEVNIALAQSLAEMDAVTLVDLYREYPTLEIDVDREQQRLRQHDIIVFLHPLYWYSAPAILKEWQDLVLEYGFAYGSSGLALKGKWFLNIISAGGKAEAYQAEGYNHYTLAQLMRPFEMTATLCHMDYLPALVLFDARTAAEQHRILPHIQRVRATLRKLQSSATLSDAHAQLSQLLPSQADHD